MRRISMKNEQGAVSLLTVIFVMIFISLIVVAYIGLVTVSQRQSTDNSLSASALAAARNGIEDGKRILLYCAQNPGDSDCDSSVLNSKDNCQAFRGGKGATLAGKVGIALTNPGREGLSGGAIGSGAEDYQQYYTCLTIQQDTPYVTEKVTSGSSYIQELRPSEPFNRLNVSWSGTGSYRTDGSTINWPQLSNWSYPPVLELQLISYKPDDFASGGEDSLDAIERQARTVYIVPCGAKPRPSGCPDSLDSEVNMSLIDNRAGGGLGSLRPDDGVPIVYAACNFPGNAGYKCGIILRTMSTSGPSTKYYSRISVIYGESAEVQLSMMNGSNVVNFDNVQPWIDVTGRTNDVFRRVRAQVKPGLGSSVHQPQYALESAVPICKVMTVSSGAADTTFGCGE